MVTVSIDQGILKGAQCYTDKGTEYYEFLCVPYAKPPVGDLRFRSPQPPEPWIGVKDTTTVNLSHIACQMELFQGHYIGTEDCLYLNIFTPKLQNDGENFEFLPVMFHIHGGGFLHADGIQKSEAGPDYLIDNNVVVVSINYRLGIFGFLSLNIPEAAGNMGLKDQVQALKWVQSNINKFGGDKNNVTIFGTSAGAASVEYLMLSPRSEGLFHKAILQSGSSLNHWAINIELQKLLCKILEKLEFEGNVDNLQAVYEYLMACSPEVLVEKSFKVIRESVSERLYFGLVPTIEKDFGNCDAFLTTNPYKLLKDGKFHKVPVIKGFCEIEGYLTINEKISAVEDLKISQNFLKPWAYSMDPNDHDEFNERFAKAYNITEDITEDNDNDNILDFFSDYDFISGILISGYIMSDLGINVFLYKFTHDGKINFLKNAFGTSVKGAIHADDISYIFKTKVSHLADETDISVRDKFTKLWTNFAKSGNPVQSGEVLKWPLLFRSSPQYLNIDEEFTTKHYSETTKMEIFEEIYEKYHM